MKADQTALESAVQTLNGVDAGFETRIAGLEAKFGGADGSVEDQIADAKQEAIDAAATDATTKADAALASAKSYTNEEVAKIQALSEAEILAAINGSAQG